MRVNIQNKYLKTFAQNYTIIDIGYEMKLAFH